MKRIGTSCISSYLAETLCSAGIGTNPIWTVAGLRRASPSTTHDKIFIFVLILLIMLACCIDKRQLF